MVSLFFTHRVIVMSLKSTHRLTSNNSLLNPLIQRVSSGATQTIISIDDIQLVIESSQKWCSNRSPIRLSCFEVTRISFHVYGWILSLSLVEWWLIRNSDFGWITSDAFVIGLLLLENWFWLTRFCVVTYLCV